MSFKDSSQRTFKIDKDLKEHLLQSLKRNNMLGSHPDEYRSKIQDKSEDCGKEPDSSILLNVNYPTSLSPDLQFHMATGCQEVAPQNPGDTTAQFSTLSHKQLVESIDRLNCPSPSQLTHTWVTTNGAEQMVGNDEQVLYDAQDDINQTYSNDIEEIVNWDDRLQPLGESVEMAQQLLEDSQQPEADILQEIERSLHEHIDDELNSLRVNLHSLVADQQVHLRRYLAPTQYSEDVEDIDVISNKEDFNGPQSCQSTINLDDTGWSSDCMQSSCSTVNEPMKLEEASPDSALDIQDDMTCQQESLAVINRLTEDCEIQDVLLQLQTSAAILSHTLKRQEYSTS